MEATCSSETSVGFQRTVQSYVPADRTPHTHCYENLKSFLIGGNPAEILTSYLPDASPQTYHYNNLLSVAYGLLD
jgi:hypothetical protein